MDRRSYLALISAAISSIAGCSESQTGKSPTSTATATGTSMPTDTPVSMSTPTSASTLTSTPTPTPTPTSSPTPKQIPSPPPLPADTKFNTVSGAQPAGSDGPVMPTVRPSNMVSRSEYESALSRVEYNQVKLQEGRISPGVVTFYQDKEQKAQILVFDGAQYFYSPTVEGKLEDGVFDLQSVPSGVGYSDAQIQNLRELTPDEREQRLTEIHPSIRSVDQVGRDRYRVYIQGEGSTQFFLPWWIVEGLKLLVCMLLKLVRLPGRQTWRKILEIGFACILSIYV